MNLRHTASVSIIVRKDVFSHDEEMCANLRRTDILPIKRNAQQPQPFVPIRPSEQIGKDILHTWARLLRRKAEHADSVEEGENVRRDDLVNEHQPERDPEELDALCVGGGVREMEGWRKQSGLSPVTRRKIEGWTYLGRWIQLEGSTERE